MAHSEQADLDRKILAAEEHISVGGTYQHYKTKGLYKVLYIGLQEATEEPCVIYQNDQGKIWVRDATVWLEHVRDFDGKLVPRFAKVN